MLLLIFVLSISLPLGNLQSVNHQDIFNPFYNTNILSKSEPISFQSISGRIYEETKKEVTISPHDRNQNTQITEPIDCEKDFLNYRRKVGLSKEESKADKLNRNKENETREKDNSSNMHLDAKEETITPTKNKILETQKKEVLFDSFIVKNNLSNDNKYGDMSTLVSEIKDKLNHPIDKKFNNYRKKYEPKPPKTSRSEDQEDHLDHSLDENFGSDPKEYVNTTEIISPTEDELDRSNDDDSYNAPNKYKSSSKLMSKMEEHLLLNRSSDYNNNDSSKKYESAPELTSRNEDQDEDEIDHSTDDNVDNDSEEFKHMPKLITSNKEDLLLDRSVDENLNNESKDAHAPEIKSQNADKLDHSVEKNNDPEKYKPTPKLISLIEENFLLDRSVNDNINKDPETHESTPKLISQIEEELDRSIDDNFNINPENNDTTLKLPVDDLELNSTRRLISGTYYQPASPDDIRSSMNYNVLPTKIQRKSEILRQLIDNSKRTHSYNVITRKTFNDKKTLCDGAEGRSSSKELEQVDEETVTQVREPTKGLGISEMTKSHLMIMQHPRVCYACSSINDPSCWSPDRRTSVKYCRKDHTSCLTKVFMQKGTRYIIRDCGSTCLPKTTFESTPVYKLCTICHNDLCNSGFSTKIQVFVIIVFVLFHLIFSL